jgi:glucose/arabinose dehydrogenase
MKFGKLTQILFCLCACAVISLAQTGKPPASKPAAPSQEPDPSAKEKAAQPAAESWVVLVDAAQFSESWEQAALPFKKAISKEDWAESAQQAREPLGKLKTRKLKFSQYKDSLPSAPPGEYVLLQYDSSFEGLPKAAEVFTLTLEKDGKWRVVGYFVR